MPRKPRQHSSLDIYHVVVKGLDSQRLFEENNDYLKYQEILQMQKETCQFKLYAFCLMSNHVHLLIRANSIPLDSIFRKINTTYANWFNMKYRRSGPLQDGRYYSEPVNSLDYLLSALRYIHRNPLKAGLETSIGSDYPWNSYQSYTTRNLTNDFVDTDDILSEFDSIDDFIDFHSVNSENDFLDIHNVKRRIPDDVAIEIMNQTFGIIQPTAISQFSPVERRNAIFLLHEKGISAKQINRLAGIPRGVIDRILAKKI